MAPEKAVSVHGAFSSTRVLPRAITAILAVVAALVLSGCALGGAKGEVGEAIENFDKLVKTSQIEGELTIDGGDGKSLAMKLSFVLDKTDPAGPKSAISLNVSGAETMSMAFTQIGQSMYVTADGRTMQVEIPPSAAGGLGKQFGSEMQGELMKAVSDMVTDVQKISSGPGDTALTTYHAYIDVGEMCGGLFKTLLAGLQQSTGAASGSSGRGGFDIGTLAAGCDRLFTGNPQLWFGVGSDNTLRMLSFQARLAGGTGGAGAVDMNGRFDVVKANEPVTIVAPANAERISDPSALFGS